MPTEPFGTWPSPISPQLVTSAGLRFTDSIEVEGDTVYWVESRPSEGGRSVIVGRAPDGVVTDAIPGHSNARSRVHEYGGGAYAVGGGALFYVEFSDQRIHRIDHGQVPVPITPEPPEPAGLRYADMAIGDGWLICVREEHGGEDEAVNTLVRIDLDGASQPEVIASGHDFYATPRISPDGSSLAWITWDHPDMPWNGSTLWLADLDSSGRPGPARELAGGRTESIYQPEWSPDGTLHFASDRSGWWNLYRWTDETAKSIDPIDADVGIPQWVFRTRRYAFVEDGSILAVVATPSGDVIRHLGTGAEPVTIPTPFTTIRSTFAIAGRTAFLLGGAPDAFISVAALDIDDGAIEMIRQPEGAAFGAHALSTPVPITFGTPDGIAHAFYYPPTLADHTAPDGDLPPLLVMGHGGPTSATTTVLDPETQFWTSRGFAVIDVDYGGSTGYGRAYWERLGGTWGIVDVRDCAMAARHLIDQGLADPERISFRGWSAGGYTTLAALAFDDVATAGASHFGVADLSLLAEHTHKFESRYLDWLVGPYPADRAVYEARSPLFNADGIDAPVILFQGLEDRVVPPEQARQMESALRGRGIPVALIEYEGEGHGFRSEHAQIATMEAELSFYGQVWGFRPADRVTPVVIDGLPADG